MESDKKNWKENKFKLAFLSFWCSKYCTYKSSCDKIQWCEICIYSSVVTYLFVLF